MNEIILMLINAASYTICTVNDKKTVSKGGLSGSEFTFLVSLSTAFFMLLALPFLNIRASLCPMTFVICVLLILDKLAEFYMAAVSLSVLSAFEVKAWLGLALFLSYASDCLFFGEQPSAAKILCLPAACLGLALIASSGKSDSGRSADKKKALRKIIPALMIYIFSKYAYGLIMRAGEPYLTKNTGLLISMLSLSVIMLPFVFPKNKAGGSVVKRLYSERERPCELRQFKRVLLIVFLTRIPNIAGLLAENALIGISLTLYSFVQPLILVTLFFISVIKRERFTGKSLVGSVICILSIVGFQLLR
ncbi:MAG: hypothetical protein ACI4JW_04780 [Oscillospiraceae bacterium]